MKLPTGSPVLADSDARAVSSTVLVSDSEGLATPGPSHLSALLEELRLVELWDAGAGRRLEPGPSAGPRPRRLRPWPVTRSRGPALCRRLEEPRPELDINLNPCASESRGVVPGLGSRTQVQVVDGSGPTKKCR